MSQTPTAIIERARQLAECPETALRGDRPECALLEDDATEVSVIIDDDTTIGEGTTVWPHAVIGTKTQDLKFRGEKTFVLIGKKCEIREFVTSERPLSNADDYNKKKIAMTFSGTG